MIAYMLLFGKMMNKIIFYVDKRGNSELRDYIETLKGRASRSKEARIQYRQIIFVVELLRLKGTALPENYTKYLGEGLWELRPGCNRVFYFLESKDEYVLLHHFRKRTQATPKREIEKAKKEIADFLSRKEQENREIN